MKLELVSEFEHFSETTYKTLDKFGYKIKELPKTPEELFEKALEAAKKVGENRRAFRRMLETYMPQVSYSVSKIPRILDLGCGRCYEAHVLSGYFGNQPFGWDSKDVLVMGIDINEKEIKRARYEYSSPDFSGKITKWTERSNYKFIHGDARNLRKLVDGKFDIVVARHPNIAETLTGRNVIVGWKKSVDRIDKRLAEIVAQDTNLGESPYVWDNIFREAGKAMRPKGLLIATSFSDIEHEMLEETVLRSGYKIFSSHSNVHSIPLSHPEVSIDRNILFAKPKIRR